MCRLLFITLSCLVLTAFSLAKDAPSPLDLGKLWSESTTLEASKDYNGALKAMQAYKDQGGDAFLASLRMGWLHYQNAQYPQSEKAYGRAQTLKPTSLNATLGLLNAVQAQIDPRKTAQAAEAVLKIQSSNYRALMVLAGLSFAQKDYRKASAAYGRVLMTFPDDPDALSGAAWSALRAGDKASAVTTFSLLLSISPQYASAQEGFAEASKTK